jgi:hypothetical protein
MLQNDVLDVEQPFDTAENEPLQIPESGKPWVHYACPVMNSDKRSAGDRMSKR